MALAATPSQFWVQQANAQVYLSWNLAAGATSYEVQRSTDGVTYVSYATVTPAEYLDTSVTGNTQYWYKVGSVNGSGTSPYTPPQSTVPTVSGQTTLGAVRLLSQQRADRVNSQFVTLPEWNNFIRLAQYELYDLLIDQNQNRYVAAPAAFTSSANQNSYALPNGVLSFTSTTGTSFVARPFYKMLGVDMGLTTASNAWVSLRAFNFIDRNKFIYPNTSSTIYGVYNCQYRILDSNLEFIPTPSGNQPFRIWYIPKLAPALKDTDVIDGVSGWEQYIICRAAKYALDKEESDTTKLDNELLFLKQRIEAASKDLDVGQADTISDTRTESGGFGGPIGGF